MTFVDRTHAVRAAIAAREEEARTAVYRWCVADEMRWRGDTPCYLCGEEGVMGEHEPPGWPVVDVNEAVEPRRDERG